MSHAAQSSISKIGFLVVVGQPGALSLGLALAALGIALRLGHSPLRLLAASRRRKLGVYALSGCQPLRARAICGGAGGGCRGV